MTWSAVVRTRLGALALDVQLADRTGVTALLGPNGAGKTSLVRVLAGLLRPDAGRVVVGGEVVCDLGAGLCLPPEDRRVGYVPQGYALFPHLTALDNVAFGLRGRRTERRERARAVMAELSADGLVDRRVGALSGGERQRVALARALAVQPRLLLLDEPLAALDVGVRRTTRAYLGERVRQVGVPVVLVTHDVRDVDALADHVVVLEEGRVAQEGTGHEVGGAPEGAFAAEFFGVRT